MSFDNQRLNFLSDLISIKSVAGPEEPNAPYGKGPKAALARFLKEARDMGLPIGVINNRVGFVDIGEGEKIVGILCHLDVVPASIEDGWNTDPFTLTVMDNQLFGRGVVDDKGPACAALFALKRLVDDRIQLDSRVRLIVGTDEERGCSCVDEYVKSNEPNPDIGITPDAQFPVIFAEKGILQVELTAAGSQNFIIEGGSAANAVPASCTLTYEDEDDKPHTLKTHGKSAHASTPELGINAIALMPDQLRAKRIDFSYCPVLCFIDDYINNLGPEKLTGCKITDMSGGVTVNCGLINVNSESQSIVLDIRYPYSASLSDLLVDLTSNAAEYGLKLKVLSHQSPLNKDMNSREIQSLNEIWKSNMEKFSGFHKDYEQKYRRPIAIGGGTYARHMPNIIAFGPQAPWNQDQCHQANESMFISDYEALEDILYDAIVELSYLSLNLN